jgi:hypothetical protein
MTVTFAAARAADPNFCQDYARAAMNQVRIAHDFGSCASRIGGGRWSYDYNRHFNWCLGAPYEAAQSEREFRRRFLDRCTHGG